jgi:hypothetical protein
MDDRGNNFRRGIVPWILLLAILQGGRLSFFDGWFSNLLKGGIRIAKTLCWPGEKGMKQPDTFNNPGTADKPIDEIVDFSKTKKEDK